MTEFDRTLAVIAAIKRQMTRSLGFRGCEPAMLTATAGLVCNRDTHAEA